MLTRRVLLGVGLLGAACGPVLATDGGGTGNGSASGTSQQDSESSGEVLCEPDAILCDGSEYGTWRLSSADAQVSAYLYLWPSDAKENGEFVSRWFIDDAQQEYCTRNGRYLPSGDLESTLVLQTVGQGGTNIELCGGDPSSHELRLELSRLPTCSGEVLELTVTDSQGASLYAIEGNAVHCGCETDYDPYSGLGEPLPTENCLAP